jgi:hypothetical protein
MTPDLFERAKREPKFRQSYVEQLDLGPRGVYVKDVQIVDGQQYSNFFMGCVQPIRALWGAKRGKSKIEIYSRAFSNELEGDFLSDLIDHELIHAEQNYHAKYQARVDKIIVELNGLMENNYFKMLDQIKRKRLAEQEAYSHQIFMFPERENISNKHIERTKSTYLRIILGDEK